MSTVFWNCNCMCVWNCTREYVDQNNKVLCVKFNSINNKEISEFYQVKSLKRLALWTLCWHYDYINPL